LKRAVRPALVVAALAACGIGTGGPSRARADNYVSVRGQYYREPSTRVVQPVVEVAKDAPYGIDVAAHYLLDAITSASAASGPSSDSIFTEYRSEAGLRVGKTWSRLRVAAAYKYSAESDYWSHTVSGLAALRTWGDTATWSLTFGRVFDQVGKRVLGNAPPQTSTGGPCVPVGQRTCPLDTTFGGLWYSQVLSPTALVQVGYEFAWLSGYLASPYRMEVVPDKRMRNAAGVRVAKYFPGPRTGLQMLYRYYWDFYPGDAWQFPSGDPWHVRSHTVEGRIFQAIGSDLELRLTGRFYSQGAANMWCDLVERPGCNQGSLEYSTDPKLSMVATEFIEGKLYWEAAAFRGLPLLGWFAAGTFELSYGRFFQNTTFGNAHVVQTGYLLPF
jgi:Protein of unknown function (DUF3570)